MKYKVLFFDSWKGGIGSFHRLVQPLKAVGIDSMLLHLGSWGNEPVCVREETLKDLKIRDISYYNSKNFDEILDIEKPDLVLFLSTATFAHRAFIRYCHIKNIPTLFTFHSIARVESVDKGDTPYKTNIIAYIIFVLQRLPTLLTKALPCYIRALIKTKATKKDWFYLIENLIDHVRKPSKRKVSLDAKTTLCSIYTDVDKTYAIEAYGFAVDEIISVGNPDLIEFGFKAAHVGCMHNLASTSSNDKVLYIDTGYAATGLFFANGDEQLQHIVATSNALRNQGKEMYFKPHPATLQLLNLDILKKENIKIINNPSLITTLQSCCAVIAETSTLALIPALMGLPLLLPRYGKLHALKFGHVLSSYPNTQILSNLDNFKEAITQCQDGFDGNKLKEWTATNLGPLPAEDMPKRVTDIVLSLIHQNK